LETITLGQSSGLDNAGVEEVEMAIDISNLSLAELKALAGKIEKRIKELQLEKRDEVLTQMKSLAAEACITPDMVAKHLRSPRTRAAAKAKYRNPENPSQTWAGRGRKPVWLQMALNAGRKLEEFAIKE
jgi:DNA-binding protein H-NS